MPSRKYSTDNVLPKIKENNDTNIAWLLKDVEFLSLTIIDIMTTHWIGDEFFSNVRQLFSMHKRSKDHILDWLYVKLWNQC